MVWSQDASCARSLDKHGTAHLVYSDQMFKKTKQKQTCIGRSTALQTPVLYCGSSDSLATADGGMDPRSPRDIRDEMQIQAGWSAHTGTLLGMCVCHMCAHRTACMHARTHRYRISSRFFPLQSQVCSPICALTSKRPPLATISSHNQQVQPSPAEGVLTT